MVYINKNAYLTWRSWELEIWSQLYKANLQNKRWNWKYRSLFVALPFLWGTEEKPFSWIPAWLKQSCSRTRSMGWTRDALLDYSTCYIYPLGCACKPIQYQDSKFSSYKNMNHMYGYLMKDPQCCLVLPKLLTVSKLLPCFWIQRQAGKVPKCESKGLLN